MDKQQFDYIIIGAGTAGCLLANRLSADPSKRVLLLEAGGPDNYHWIHIPVGYLYCIGNPQVDWCFQTEASAGLNGRSLRYPRGKTLGGSSSINGMIYMRGQSRDYQRWAEITGDDEWRWDNCLQDFRQHESHYRLDNANISATQAQRPDFAELHGRDGEWRVEKQRLNWEILDAFSAAAQQYGIVATDDFNRGDNEGVSYFEVNQKSGWRWNTAKAFLRPQCKNRNNFTLITSAHVKKLLLEKQADGGLLCSGVSVVHHAERQKYLASTEVILCAGAIGSPQILELSGIGQAKHLRTLGIETKLDLPGVGENLQDHLQIRSTYKVTGVDTLNTRAANLWGKFKIALEYGMHRSGPMSMAPSQLGAFTRSQAEMPFANLQYHVQPLSLDAFGSPLHNFNAFTASVCNLNPTSRGSTHIKSPDFQEAPAIAPNYLSTDEDRQTAADSLRITRKIVAQPALQKYQPEELKPGTQFQTDEELVHLAGDIATTIFHPVGSLKMGITSGNNADPMAVVDRHLRVRGINHLRVADASIMPFITSGNTNSPTLMIAEKAARWIKAGS